MRTTIICLLLSAVAISADLQADFRDIASHLPIEQLELIGQKYIATDPSIRARVENMQALPHEEIVKGLLEVKEVQDLVSYLNRRGIDAEQMLDHGIQKTQAFYRKLLEQNAAGLTGSNVPITGNFIADCMRAISSSDVLSVIKEKIETSEDFAYLAAVGSEPEFKTLLYRLMNSKGLAKKCSFLNDPYLRGFSFSVGFSISW